MKHLRSLLLVACIACSLGCDKPEPTPDEIAQNQKAREGIAWRDLLQSLEAAGDDDAKIRLLEKFIADYPAHPDISEAKRQLAEVRNDPDANARTLIAETAKKATEEGQPRDVIALFASESIRLASTRLDRDALADTVEVPTSAGVKLVEKSLFVHPLVLRGHIRNALREHVATLPERCDRQCVNESAGALFQKAVGAPVFVGDGKMSPDAVGPLLEKAWISPETPLLGIPASTWYAIYAPTFRAYAQIGHAMKAADPKAAADKLAALATAPEVAAFYTSFTTEQKLAEKTGLDPKDARAIAGWWLRRYADGTAPSFDAYVTRVREAYDPELELP